MRFVIILLLLGLLPLAAHAQMPPPCEVNASISQIEIFCGEQVTLNAIGSTTTIFEDDFNNGEASNAWQSFTTAQFDDPCTPTPDQTPYAWFVENGGPRGATTKALDLSSGGFINFTMKYAQQADNTPCEGPDLANEGIYLEFSIDGGLTWQEIEYYFPLGGYNPTRLAWTAYVAAIPPQAQTTGTMIRWIQKEYSPGGGTIQFDYWGLDNIFIEVFDADAEYIWQHTGISKSDGSTEPVQPTENTTYYVNYRNGNCTAIDSVSVVVNPFSVVASRTSGDLFCVDDVLNLFAESSIESTAPTECGLSNKTVCDPIFDRPKEAFFGSGIQFFDPQISSFPNFPARLTDAQSQRQFIITAQELTDLGLKAGTLTEIQFEVAARSFSARPIPDLIVKGSCTTQDALDVWDDNPEVLGTYQNVNFLVGYNSFPLQNGLNWDGTSNLVFEFCFIQPEGNLSFDWNPFIASAFTNTSFNSFLARSALNTSSGTCEIDGAQRLDEGPFTIRPNVILNFCQPRTPNIDYSWTPNDGNLLNPFSQNSELVISGSKTYTVTTRVDGAPEGCAASDSVSITVDSLHTNSLEISFNEGVCAGDSIKLRSSDTNFPLGDDLEWTGPNNFSSNLAEPTIADVNEVNSGWYRFRVSRNGCGLFSDSILVNVQRSLNPGEDAALQICQSDSLLDLFALLGNSADSGGFWQELNLNGEVVNNRFDLNTVSAGLEKNYRFQYYHAAPGLCTDTLSEIDLSVIPAPTLNLVPDFLVQCQDSTVTLRMDISGSSPDEGYTVRISDSFDLYPNPNENVKSGDTFSIQLASSRTFRLLELTDNSPLKCPSTENVTLDLKVFDQLIANVIEEPCLDGNGFFIPTIEITGGDTNGYVYDLFVEGVLIKENETVNSLPLRQDTIADGSVYRYVFRDLSNCDSTQSFLDRSLPKYCNCVSSAGRMLGEPLDLCEDVQAITDEAVQAFLEFGDTLFYILHDRGGILEGNIFDSSAVPSFDFKPNEMEYNRSYYISAVVGDKGVGSSFLDPTDTCKSVSRGTEVIWRQKPNLESIAQTTVICAGQTALVNYKVTGNAPFTLYGHYTNSEGIKMDTTFVLPFNVGSFPVDLNRSRTFNLDSISDGNKLSDNLVFTKACGSPLNVSFQILVNQLPEARFLNSAALIGCEGETLNGTIALSGQAPFDFNYKRDNELFKIRNFTGQNFPIVLTEKGRLELISVVDATQCVGDITGPTVVDVDIRKRPVAKVKSVDNAVCGNVVDIEATPSFGIGTWTAEGGATVGNPNVPFTIGIGNFSDTVITFTWTERNPPCPDSQDSVEVFFRLDPLPFAGDADTICGLQYALNPEPSITESQGKRSWTQVSGLDAIFDNNLTPKATVKVPQSGTYTFAYTENIGGVCVNSDTVQLLFINEPIIKILDTLCDDVAENYSVRYQIIHGIPTSISTNGDKLFGNVYQISAKSGDTLNIWAKSNIACAPQSQISIVYQCPCISSIGVLRSDTVKACRSDLFSFVNTAAFVKDPNDTLVYVIKESPNAENINDIIYSSATNRFTFDYPSLQAGKVYYMMAYVGNAASNASSGLSKSDACRAATPPVALIVEENYQLIFPTRINFCAGQNQGIAVGNIPPSKILTLNSRLNGTERIFELSSDNDSIKLNLPEGQHFLELGQISSSDAFACAGKNTNLIEINVMPKPALNLVSDDSVCVGENVRIDLFTDASHKYTLVVDNDSLPALKNNYRYQNAGIFTIKAEVTDGFGCKNEATKKVSVQAIPTPNFQNDSVFCFSDNINARVLGSNPDIEKREWRINGDIVPGNLVVSHKPVSPGMYTITLNEISNHGCAASHRKSVRVHKPNVRINQLPDSLCSSEPLELRFLSGDSTTTHHWSYSGFQTGESQDIFHQVDLENGNPNEGFLDVKLFSTDIYGCSDSVEKSIKINYLKANFFFNEEKLCTPTLLSTANASVNGDVFRWTIDGIGTFNTFNISDLLIKDPIDSLRIHLEAYNALWKCTSTKVRYVDVFQSPILSVRLDSACPNKGMDMQAFGADIYAWSPGDNLSDSTRARTRFLAGGTSQTIVLKGANIGECTTEIEVDVHVRDIKEPINLGFIDTVNVGDSVRIRFEREDGMRYNWFSERLDGLCSNCTDTVIYLFDDTEIIITTSDKFGCYQKESFLTYRVNELYTLDFPDAFTPNGDGINDHIRPDGLGVASIELVQIFTREGSLVFEGNKENISWDGFYQGKPMPAERYAYRVIARFVKNGGLRTIRGSFDLIR